MSIPVFGMSDPEFKKALKKTKTAIVPIGSLEQHGPHLPVSTDCIIVNRVADLLGEKIGAMVLPVIQYGVSFEHRPMFNLSLRHAVLSDMVCDICTSLCDNGLKNVVLLNGHHGNTGALRYVSQDLIGRTSDNMRILTMNYWNVLDQDFDHAGLVETSLVLAISPELVNMKKAAGTAKPLSKSKAAYESMTNQPGSFPLLTGNGVWGDPRNATAVKGRKWLRQIVVGLTRTTSELGL
jgi:creatinine amidohydrolase